MADQLVGIICMLSIIVVIIVALFYKYVDPVKTEGNEYEVVARSIFAGADAEGGVASKVLLATRASCFIWFFCVVWVYRWVEFFPNYW